jgi:hypothetical protein
MPNNKCVTALFDTCAVRDSPAEAVWLELVDGSVPSLRGPRNSIVKMTTRSTPKIPNNERFKREQSDAMISVGNLAREGRVHLYVYTEIELEALKGTGFPSRRIADSLYGVKIDRVRAAIERSRFQQMPIDEFLEENTRIDFFRWLLSLDEKALMRSPKSMDQFSAWERRNLESLGRFREICKHLAPKHFNDAFHLWTAEVNTLDYFLTVDGRFFRALTESSRIDFTTRLIHPSDFVTKLTGSN